jgi:sporulation-control protein spo0M
LKNHWRISNAFSFPLFPLDNQQEIKEEEKITSFLNKTKLLVNVMGNGNSLINVTLDKSQPAVYFAGEILSGQVHFHITERTKRIDEIYLSLTGDIGYTTSREVRMQNGQVERKIDNHDVRILGQKFLLGHPMINVQTNREINPNEITTLEPGQYKYPFSIRLPEDLPPTLHPEDYPFVRYQIQVSRNHPEERKKPTKAFNFIERF